MMIIQRLVYTWKPFEISCARRVGTLSWQWPVLVFMMIAINCILLQWSDIGRTGRKSGPGCVVISATWDCLKQGKETGHHRYGKATRGIQGKCCGGDSYGRSIQSIYWNTMLLLLRSLFLDFLFNMPHDLAHLEKRVSWNWIGSGFWNCPS